MIDDFNDSTSDLKFSADVCIVGSGAAGLSIIREFIGTELRVLVLESGGLSSETQSQELCHADAVGIPFPGAHTGRAREFGGTTTLWGGGLMPLQATDFHQRDWIPYSGWPISHKDLIPYYRRAKPVARMSAANDEQNTSALAPPVIDRQQLNWNYSFSHSWRKISENNPKHLRDSYIKEFRQASNVCVLLHANAMKIRTSENGRVDGIEIGTLGGKRGYARARVVILACGGIEVPRLLLLSQQDGQAHGLPAQKNVGRYFQSRPKFNAAKVQPNASARVLHNLFERRRVGDRTYRIKLTLSEETQKHERLPQCDAGLEFDLLDKSGIRAAKSILRGQDRSKSIPSNLLRMTLGMREIVSYGLPKLMTGNYPAGLPVNIRLECRPEQLPNPDSRIVLSRQRDALGLPKSEIRWQLGELERAAVRRMTEIVAVEFNRQNWGRVLPADWLQTQDSNWREHVTDGNHHSGTTRMADDPTTGVVDRNCKVHGIDNLFISSSSVFPTTGTAAPTFTIMALSIRLADHIKNKLKPGNVQAKVRKAVEETTSVF